MIPLHVVVGAGAVGSALARVLVTLGCRVRSVSRAGATTVPGAEPIAADIRDRTAMASAVAGASVVYQCAQPPYHRWAAEFPTLQAAVVDASAAVGADLVIADNLYMYGAPDGSTIDEQSPERPASRKGAVRKGMADTALAAHRDGRLRVALSRPAHYFGPAYDQNGSSVFGAAMRGQPMQFLGRPHVPHSFSFVPDVAAAMARLGTSDTGWGQVWIPPVQPALEQAEFAERIWRAAGQSGRPRTRYVGRLAARLLGAVSPTVRELSEMMYEFEAPYVVDSSRFEAAFGLAPTSSTQAIAETLRWYGR